MRKIITSVLSVALGFAGLMACSAEAGGEDFGDEGIAVQEESLESEAVAAGCGRITLEYCANPSYPGRTATCRSQYYCDCREVSRVCVGLANQYCGSYDRVVPRNCFWPDAAAGAEAE